MTHETPTQEIFEEIKEAAKRIWNTYDNAFGYVDEKMETINNLTNYQDNIMVCYRMFDSSNQNKMTMGLSEDANIYINENH